MRISTTANSGCCSRTSRINSDPSPAWPTTSYPLRSSRLQRPSRINTSSSATTTRVPSGSTSVTTRVSRRMIGKTRAKTAGRELTALLAVRKGTRAPAGTSSRAYDLPGYAVALAGRRSGDRPLRARPADSEELGPVTRRGRARSRPSTTGDGRDAADDRRVVAASACHGPGADRRPALDRGGPVRDSGGLARAPAWGAQARVRGATPVAGRGVRQPGPGDRSVWAHPLPGWHGVAE